MKTILKIAWRNIWRNKRRTLITVSSIMFALFFAIIMRGFQRGSYAKMKQNAIESYSGYVQIHKKGYWNDKNINTLFSEDSLNLSIIKSDSRIKVIIPRLESFALASSGEFTKGIEVIGISPNQEDKMTKIKSYLSKGAFINKNDKSVLLAADLAKFLKLKVNDTLVLYSSGYHGATAAGLFPVKGIVKLPVPEMNRSTLYMPIKLAKNFFSTNDKITGLVIDLYHINDANGVEKLIKSSINNNKFEVIDWKVMNKDLLQMIASDNAGGLIMIAILYLVIAFGIFGTVLMMTSERIREFSVMISIGMQKSKLAIVVVFELFFITILALITGIAISLPVLFYYHYNPIKMTGDAVTAMKNFNFEPVMPMSINPQILLYQGIAVALISLIAMFYPVLKILTLDIVKGLKS
jgi:ABC-type lipoprotein release transport system permease subunit